jgi:ArsR family transcriptional regulator
MNNPILDPFSAAADPQALAVRLAALSHPARIRILQHLASRSSCCCREVVEEFELAQSTVSQHLKVLVEAGLVKFAPDRQRSRYALDAAALSALAASMQGLARSCCPAADEMRGGA